MPRFTLNDLAPFGKQRPFFVVKGKTRRGRHNVVALTPQETRDYEKEVRFRVIQMLGESFVSPMFPTGTPVMIDLDFVSIRPKKYQKKKDSSGLIWCQNVPDVDNLEKAVIDALHGLMWKDDRQVVSIRSQKFYTEKGNNEPRVCIFVREAGNPPIYLCDSWSDEAEQSWDGANEEFIIGAQPVPLPDIKKL